MTQVRTNTFEIKRGDTAPRLETVLRADGVPVDLTSAISVGFTMSLCNYPHTVKIDHATANFSASASGEVSYDWDPGDTDTVGRYDAEWTVIFPGSNLMTFPSAGFDVIEVTKSLAA